MHDCVDGKTIVMFVNKGWFICSCLKDIPDYTSCLYLTKHPALIMSCGITTNMGNP